jgi:hypothetical protein
VRKSELGRRRLDHCLGYVRELHRRCVVDGEPCAAVAAQCGQNEIAVKNIVHMLREHGRLPSDERLACIAMQDPGLDDDDIADIFGRTKRWARTVRSLQEDIEASEQMPEELTWFKGHITKEDPTPREIEEMCARALANRRALSNRPRSESLGGSEHRSHIRQILRGTHRGVIVYKTIV